MMQRRANVCWCLVILATLGCQPTSPPANERALAPKADERPAEPTLPVSNSYVNDQECRDCHADLYDSYQHVSMSQSLTEYVAQSAPESFENGHFYHAASDRHYQMEVRDGDLWMTRYRLRDEQRRIYERSHRVDFVIGSGNHVRTYVYRHDSGEMFQMPVVWYSQDQQWGMAPGYDHADHEGFDRPITRQCMFCHNAYPSRVPGDDVFGAMDRFPQQLPLGIGCQRCHGPGNHHVLAVEDPAASDQTEKNSIVNPADLPLERQEEVCLQCHLQPVSRRSSLVRRWGRGDYSFLPGDNLNDYLAVLDLADAKTRDEHFEINHHPYRLRQSACYLNSAKQLQCTTCHDPHHSVPPENRVAHYRQACLTCHQRAECPDEAAVLPKADCVSCHMATRRTQDVVHVTMTDHRIVRRFDAAAAMAPIVEKSLPVGEPMEPYARLRPTNDMNAYVDLAGMRDQDPDAVWRLWAQYQATGLPSWQVSAELGQNLLQLREFEAARTVLQGVLDDGHDLPIVRSNLGAALTGLRQYDPAIQQLQAAIRSEPDRPESHYNLGIALNRNGQPEASVQAYLQALALRPTYANAHFNLGNALARAKQLHEARRHFQATLNLNPDRLPAYGNLAATHRDLGDWRAAIEVLADGLRLAPTDQRLMVSMVRTHLDAPREIGKTTEALAWIRRSKGKESAPTEWQMLLEALCLLADPVEDAGAQDDYPRIAAWLESDQPMNRGRDWQWIRALYLHRTDRADELPYELDDTVTAAKPDALSRLIERCARRVMK